MDKGIIALYPGKFKPFTGGHYSLVKRYLESDKIEKLIIVISNKDKDGFKAEDSKQFIESLFSDYIGNKLEVNIAKELPSPVAWCYDYVINLSKNYDEVNYVCMVSSSKEGDDSRLNYFEKSFIDGGKYASDNIIVKNPRISIEPVTYKNRKDTKDTGFKTGDFISGTAARDDVMNNNLSDFLSNYPQDLFKMPEYKDMLNTYFNSLRKTLINNGVKVNEGGAAGHMSHVVDINDFTFGDYRNIIDGILENKFAMTEKVDGLNCFISYRDEDKQFVVARNKTHLRGNPLTIDELTGAFSNDTAGKVYYIACLELSKTLSKLGHDVLSKIFNNATTWMNFEIIDSKFSNIVYYSKSLIIIHNFQDYVNDEKYISDVNNYNIKYIAKFLETQDFSKNYFKISGPININMNKGEEISKLVESKKEEFDSELKSIMNKLGANDETTMADYMEHRIEVFLDKNNITLTPEVMSLFMDRWINSNKKIRINIILNKIEDEETRNRMKEFDKSYNIVEQKLKKPVHDLFVKLGDFILSLMDNLVNSDEDTSKINKDRIESRLNNVKSTLTKEQVEKYADIFDNIHSINPSEGITFVYKDHLLKLTGSFYYINKVFHVNSDGIFSQS